MFSALGPFSPPPGRHGGGPSPEGEPQQEFLRPAGLLPSDAQRQCPEPAASAAGGCSALPDALLPSYSLDPAVCVLPGPRGDLTLPLIGPPPPPLCVCVLGVMHAESLPTLFLRTLCRVYLCSSLCGRSFSGITNRDDGQMQEVRK